MLGLDEWLPPLRRTQKPAYRPRRCYQFLCFLGWLTDRGRIKQITLEMFVKLFFDGSPRILQVDPWKKSVTNPRCINDLQELTPSKMRLRAKMNAARKQR
jgi:hypothetical protein